MVEMVARTPLDGWTTSFHGLGIAELPTLTQLDVRVDPEGPGFVAIGKALGGELPTPACTSARIGDVDVLWLGPDEWLLIAAPGRQDELSVLLREAIGQEHGAVVDVSAQRTTLALTGPVAHTVLARGCAIDLDPRVAPTGTCVQTLLARTGITILVQDALTPEFRLFVRASFAQYLASWLVDAAEDL